MTNFICATCGVQHGETETEEPPENCRICEDERQYIGHNGQRWTTIAELKKDHHNRIEEIEPDLTGIGTVPGFAIGQRALLVRTPNGNVLWDCISLLDEDTVEAVHSAGWHLGHCRLASAHGRIAGGMEPCLRLRAHLLARRQPPLGDAPRPGIRILGGRDLPADGWHHPGPLRRSLRGVDRPALVPGCGGTRRPADRRHHAGRLRTGAMSASCTAIPT